MFRVRVQREDFDPENESGSALGAGAGALASFTGYCRDEEGRLAGLEIEHYPGMAEAEIEAVLERARERWPLLGASIVHRHGWIAAGERIVFVAVSAVHRGAAFSAAEYLMDYLKTSAPFWKRERRRDGSWGEWVAASGEDEAAAARWLDSTSETTKAEPPRPDMSPSPRSRASGRS